MATMPRGREGTAPHRSTVPNQSSAQHEPSSAPDNPGQVGPHEATVASDVESGPGLDKGPFALGNLEKLDEAYRWGNPYHDLASYCHLKRCERLDRLREDAIRAERIQSEDRHALAQTIDKELREHQESLVLSRAVNDFRKPNKAVWKQYVARACDAMGADWTSSLPDDTADCVALHSIDRIHELVRSMVQCPFGAYIFARFREERHDTAGCDMAVYGEGWSIVIGHVVFVFIVSAFFGIPVALQALEVTNAAMTVVSYFVFLLCFVGVAELIFSTPGFMMMATIAFASIFASLIGR